MLRTVCAFQCLTDSRDSSVAGKAASLLESVSTPGFRLSLEILCLVLNITKPLSVRLQSPKQDFLQALESVRDAVRVLQSLRDDPDRFNELYTAVEEAVGDVPMPRWAKVTNPTVRCARQYYKVSVYLAFIDTCLGQLRERFESHLARGARLSALLPAVCTRSSCSFEQLRPAVDMYSRLLDSSCDQVRSELCCSTRFAHFCCSI